MDAVPGRREASGHGDREKGRSIPTEKKNRLCPGRKAKDLIRPGEKKDAGRSQRRGKSCVAGPTD